MNELHVRPINDSKGLGGMSGDDTTEMWEEALDAVKLAIVHEIASTASQERRSALMDAIEMVHQTYEQFRLIEEGGAA